MLVENHQPCSRSIGGILLIPGINRLDKKDWDLQLNRGYKKSVEGLFDDGILSMIEDGKITVALVGKTLDPEILEDWLSDAKGPVKGAIKKQLKLLEVPEKE